MNSNKNTPFLSKPGISFSFDDSFRVKHWYKYGKEIFGYHDVKATFNINAFHHFEGRREHTQEEIDMLLELQANGHEIAHHGYKHHNAKGFSDEKGLSSWLEEEIIPLFTWMENQSHSKTKERFKKPVTYAFPYSHYNEGNIKELVPKYFKIVRGHLTENNLIPFNFTGLAPSIRIDSNFLTNVKYIKRIMRLAKKSGKNLIFMCHSLIPEEINWKYFGWGEDSNAAGEWRISPKVIKEIIGEAKKLDLEFYTTAEIAGVATFIDKNLENCARKHILNSDGPWISISELSMIKELDLSGKNISNLDGIQYFVNLEKLNLKDNNISDFRILEKLKKLKDFELSNNHY
ncbi:polysaccharide deacetylase family protein [Neobacillus sp. OS1-33]|uniref:polysaccharide deacetylase family protein n=1 Tax=Neobacillus sp. OS1-33 TaxID=3070683 RepID=UPI0027E17E22|nr:polysaccharide deacetylase family protein [Neobacillus sp. OS1-33]WML25160.1 polysaccharide deacetylase family protein [Neobacillus sp. OS1-33]